MLKIYAHLLFFEVVALLLGAGVKVAKYGRMHRAARDALHRTARDALHCTARDDIATCTVACSNTSQHALSHALRHRSMHYRNALLRHRRTARGAVHCTARERAPQGAPQGPPEGAPQGAREQYPIIFKVLLRARLSWRYVDKRSEPCGGDRN